MVFLETSFGIGVAKGGDILCRHQHLFSCPQADEIIPQSSQKVQPSCADNVVQEYEVLIREGPEA